MTTRFLRRLGWLAIGSVAYHALVIVSLHVLQPEVSPLSAMVGAYLEGPYQTLSRTTFLAFALAFGALALGLRPLLAAGLRSAAATMLMTLSAVGFLGVGLLPGMAARLGAAVRPVTVAMMLTVSFVLRKEPRWESRGAALVAVSGLLVCVFLLTFTVLLDLGLGGLANRLVLVLIYIWISLVAWGLIEPLSD